MGMAYKIRFTIKEKPAKKVRRTEIFVKSGQIKPSNL